MSEKLSVGQRDLKEDMEMEFSENKKYFKEPKIRFIHLKLTKQVDGEVKGSSFLTNCALCQE